MNIERDRLVLGRSGLVTNIVYSTNLVNWIISTIRFVYYTLDLINGQYFGVDKSFIRKVPFHNTLRDPSWSLNITLFRDI